MCWMSNDSLNALCTLLLLYSFNNGHNASNLPFGMALNRVYEYVRILKAARLRGKYAILIAYLEVLAWLSFFLWLFCFDYVKTTIIQISVPFHEGADSLWHPSCHLCIQLIAAVSRRKGTNVLLILVPKCRLNMETYRWWTIKTQKNWIC